MVHFDECEHKWEFHIDAGRSGGPGAGSSFFICKKCMNSVTLTEKCALEQTIALLDSLKIQERNTSITKWSVIIAGIALTIGIFTFLFGDKILI